MPVQDKINVIWQMIGRYMLETEFQSVSRKIDNQWPFVIAVAISADNCDRRSEGFDRLQDGRRADVAKVPDFIRAGRERLEIRRQLIVGIGEDEDANGRSHNEFSPKGRGGAPGLLDCFFSVGAVVSVV